LKTRIGEIPDDLSPDQEGVTITFSTGAASETQAWRNKNLTVDFMAEYFAASFPCERDAPKGETSRGVARSMIAFVANELLENAVKYNFDPTFPLSIGIWLRDDCVVFSSNNSVDPLETGLLQQYLHEVIAGDAMAMYLAQVEENASSGTGTDSKIGLLTLRNDYRATLGWELDSQIDQGGRTTETLKTVVQVPLT
jgi:hypothetical protein